MATTCSLFLCQSPHAQIALSTSYHVPRPLNERFLRLGWLRSPSEASRSTSGAESRMRRAAAACPPARGELWAAAAPADARAKRDATSIAESAFVYALGVFVVF